MIFERIRTRTASKVLVLTAIAVFAASCEKAENDFFTSAPEPSDNITQILASYGEPEYYSEVDFKRGESAPPTFSTLSVALAHTGLTGIVSSNRLTLFAPTDEAFAKLGLDKKNISSVPNLREILLYHVIEGLVYSNQLSNDYVMTLNSSYVKVNTTGGVMINNSAVVQADIKARNGVIHMIDNILLPPDKNIVETAVSLAPEFSILLEAASRAGLADILANGGPFTLFAPTNEAFVNLLGELGAGSLDDIPVDLLTQVLLYHVVDGYVFSTDLENGEVTSLNGKFSVSLQYPVEITDSKGRTAEIVPSLLDVQTTNGVIHVINRVILP